MRFWLREVDFLDQDQCRQEGAGTRQPGPAGGQPASILAMSLAK